LKFVSLASGSETDQAIDLGTTIPAGASLRPFFPCWLDPSQSNHDAQFDMRAPGDVYSLARETIPGIGYNAPGTGGGSGTGSPVFGTVRTIQLNGMDVGNGNFHTINFALGSVISSPTPGVLDITSAGPPGPPGPGGVATPGSPGPTGLGYTTIYPYAKQEVPINSFNAGNPWSKTFNFPAPIRFFMVNTALKNSSGELDTGHITDVIAVSGAMSITVNGEFDGGLGSLNQIMVVGVAAAG